MGHGDEFMVSVCKSRLLQCSQWCMSVGKLVIGAQAVLPMPLPMPLPFEDSSLTIKMHQLAFCGVFIPSCVEWQWEKTNYFC